MIARSTSAFLFTSLFLATAALAGERGIITFVDGTKTDAEILFKHPNAPVLIVRSPRNSTVQSFPINEVQSVSSGGRTTAFSAARALKAEEKTRRELDRLWVDEMSPKQLGKYATENWEKKPLIVWAQPGTSGDAMIAASWLDEMGKPLTAPPWNLGSTKKRPNDPDTGEFDGDALLPAADQPYDAIQAGNRDHLGEFRLRHLTVERNANYKIRYKVAGNLWLKDGSDMGGGTQTGSLGSGDPGKHTVIRFCGKRMPSKATRKQASDDAEWAALSHWIKIDTGANGSIEVVGRSGGAGDRLTLEKGTLVVSEDSYLGNGVRASFYCKPDTTTILLDSAQLGCLHKLLDGRRATYGIAGKLMFGTPEHPLKRDLRFEAAYLELEELSAAAAPAQRTAGGSIVLGSTGEMIIHSADPTKARVIFCPRPDDAPCSAPALERGKRTLPSGISAVFLGKTDFNGVAFDGFYGGGIIAKPADRAKWKNVSFGPKNLGKPETLFKAP